MKVAGIMIRHQGKEYSNKLDQSILASSRITSWQQEGALRPIRRRFTRVVFEIINSKELEGYKRLVNTSIRDNLRMDWRMDMVRSHSKMVIPSKVTSPRVNSKDMGYLNLQPIPMKASSVMVSTMGKGNTPGVLVVITREGMRMDRRVDMEYMWVWMDRGMKEHGWMENVMDRE